MDGNDFLAWSCANADWLGPALAVIFPASIASGWADAMPSWLRVATHFFGLNWGHLARDFIERIAASRGVAR